MMIMVMIVMIKKAVLQVIKPRHTPCREFHHPKMQLLSRLLLLLLLLVKVVTMLAMLATLGNALAWLCTP